MNIYNGKKKGKVWLEKERERRMVCVVDGRWLQNGPFCCLVTWIPLNSRPCPIPHLLSFFSSLYGSFSYSFSFSCPNTRPHYYQIKLHTILYSTLFYFYSKTYRTKLSSNHNFKRTTFSLCLTKSVDIDQGDDRPCLFATTIFCSFPDVFWLLDWIV